MNAINSIITNIYKIYNSQKHNFFGIYIDKEGKAYINNYNLDINNGLTVALAESLIARIPKDKMNKFVWIMDQYTWDLLESHYDDTIQDIDTRHEMDGGRLIDYQIIILDPVEEEFKKELNKYFIG